MKNKFILKSFIALIVVLVFVIFIFVFNKKNKVENENQIINGSENIMNEFVSKINMNINGINYSITLENNKTAKEFVKKLPLEINMNELNGNEKYYYFNESLPNNPAKVEKINAGDLMLYGSDCLVLFYETFNNSYSYTRIGKIDNPSSLKENVGSENVKILFNKKEGI